MPTNVIMPALELAQETGKILKWLKAPGDTVSKGEPIVETPAQAFNTFSRSEMDVLYLRNFIIEKDARPHRHMIGKFGLSMHLPPSVTSIDVPDGFLQPATAYDWEVLAIERSGNQTLSSGSFKTA